MDSTDDDEELGASPMVTGWAPPATTFPPRELAKHAAEFESAHNEVWRAMGFLVAKDEPLPLMDKTTKRLAAEQLRKLARRNEKGSRGGPLPSAPTGVAGPRMIEHAGAGQARRVSPYTLCHTR